MEIWPAIDLRGGKCVRLVQGDYDRQTVYADDPLEMARHWVDQGARRLHLVDLDGARDGQGANREIAREIAGSLDIPCQLGGGIRDEEAIVSLLDAGLSRLVIGTRAVKDPDWFCSVCQRYPGRLVVGIDARDGRVATDGWLEESQLDAVELAVRLAEQPLAGMVYTDIERDGMLQGPNLAAMKRMQHAVQVPVIASGGVSSLDDVIALADCQLAGCIIGKALYESHLQLADALQAAQDHAPTI